MSSNIAFEHTAEFIVVLTCFKNVSCVAFNFLRDLLDSRSYASSVSSRGP
jgi:hypothetical protein